MSQAPAPDVRRNVGTSSARRRRWRDLVARHLLDGDGEEHGLVRIQLAFRETNEQILGSLGESQSADLELVCECSNIDCTKPIAISLGDYESVRVFPTRFVVRPGHDAPDVERVVEATSAYVVVEKVGEGAPIAIRLDPRRRRRPAGTRTSLAADY